MQYFEYVGWGCLGGLFGLFFGVCGFVVVCGFCFVLVICGFGGGFLNTMYSYMFLVSPAENCPCPIQTVNFVLIWADGIIVFAPKWFSFSSSSWMLYLHVHTPSSTVSATEFVQ